MSQEYATKPSQLEYLAGHFILIYLYIFLKLPNILNQVFSLTYPLQF